MPELFAPLLFLHVLTAILALGPAFAFPLIGAMGGREPAHGNFATRVTHVLDDRMVRPFILLTAATGVGMIWARSLPVLDPAYRWLVLSIVLYAVALVFSLLIQRPTVLRVIELTGGSPAPRPDTPVRDGERPAGPPPELAALVGRTRRNGMVLTALSIALVLLMVVKPSLGA